MTDYSAPHFNKTQFQNFEGQKFKFQALSRTCGNPVLQHGNKHNQT